MIYVFMFLANLAFSFVRFIVAGMCLSWYWAWFVVPAFGVASLSTAHAIGLIMTVTFIGFAAGYSQHSSTKEPLYDMLAHGLRDSFVETVTFLGVTGVAYLWHSGFIH